MNHCLNPNCPKPTSNPSGTHFCLSCGSKLQMKDRYRAIKLIGQGGFGRTFLAADEDKPSKPHCVIKQFFPQAQGTNNAQKAAKLFEQEAVRLDELSKHPQIPELLAYFTQDNRQYLVREFIDGQNLAEAQAAEGAFSEAQIRDLLHSLLPVLEFIQTHNIIHRDIKPENIIRCPDGELVLVDFNVAQLGRDTALVRTGRVIDDFRYIAPEKAVGKAEFASDLYSLGVTCIHLLTQTHPFDLFSVDEDAWVWRNYLSSPVSDDLGCILDKLITRATNWRYQSPDQVIKDLNPQQTQAASKLPPLPPLPVRPAKHPSASVVTTFESNPPTQVWRCVRTLTHANWVFSVAISPDGQTLATSSADKTIKIWHLDTGKLQHTLTGHLEWVRSVAFSPDGQTLVSSSDDSTIKIWQLATGKLLHTLTGHSAPVWSVTISPDEQTLASGSKDKSIKIWDLATGQRQHTPMGHSNSVYSVAISPDGQKLASGSYDKTIKIWHLGMGQLLHVLKGHSSWVNSVAISPDGQTLASASYDKTIKLWQVGTGKHLATLTGHHSYIWSVVFSPDGQTLASGSGDYTIKLWHLSTGKRLCTLSGHSDWVNSVAFSAQGHTIASGSRDMKIKIWRCD